MLGTFALIGLCAILAVAGVTGYAVMTRPRVAGTMEPFVATGLAEMGTYQAEQTAAARSGEPTPTAPSAATVQAEQPGIQTVVPNAATGQIVYTCFINYHDDICIMNADGSNQRRLTDQENTDFYPSLSGDGQLIVWSSRRTGSFEAYVTDLTGANTQQFTQGLAGIYAPEISPDGTRVVLVSTINEKQDIYVMQLDGSGVTRVTTNPTHDIDPTWSPDGTRIAFTSNRTGTNEIFVINADGTGERQVTSGSNQREGGRLDWSPDGQWIAFYAGPQGDKDMWMVPAECTLSGPCGPDQLVRLSDGGNNKAPAFSPDSQWITFASELDGNNDVWIMRLDGTALIQLTDNTYAEWQPRWGP